MIGDNEKSMSPLGAALFNMAVDMTRAEMRVYEKAGGVTDASRIQAVREVNRIQRQHQPEIDAAMLRQRDA